MKKIIIVISLTFFCSSFILAQEHPFLIVKESSYEVLKGRVAVQPWKYMRDKSKQNWSVDFEDSMWQKMATQLSYNMILWITDDTNKIQYKNKILEIIERWPTQEQYLGTSGHTNTVDAASAFFNSIIALDLIFKNCSNQEIQSAENRLQNINNWFRDEASSSWKLSRYGVLTLWALYKNNTNDIEEYKTKYTDYLLKASMMSDGSWNQSPGYLLARIGGNRLGKSHIIDVLDFTENYSFYENQQMQDLMEWMGAFTFTPFGSISRFGDTGLIKRNKVGGSNPFLFRMSNYGAKAGAIGSWILDSDNSTGPYSFDLSNFFTFVLMSEDQYAPVKPVSLLKQNSGAALRDITDSHQALSGVLYSLKRENNLEGGFGHAHYDVNSINITGYGEHLIANAGTRYVGMNGQGFNYPGYTPDNKRWFHAWMQNTVLIGDQTEHVEKQGQGLIDGLVGGSVEFGRTGSLNALDNGKHFRYLFLIQPVPEKTNGYFALVDEVIPDDPNETIKINLHPNTSSGVVSISNKIQYSAKADGFVQDDSDNTEGILIMYGTEPEEVRIKKAYKGDFKEGALHTDYLESEYKVNNNQRLQASTVLFPYDGAHQAPVLTRISEVGFSGALIAHSTTINDVFLSSTGPGKYYNDGVLINGRAVFYRKTDGNISNYAVALGYGFDDGETIRNGFESNEVISIQMDENVGQINIRNNETNVTFYHPGLSQIFVDGQVVEPLQVYANAIEIAIPKGVHTVKLDSNTLHVNEYVLNKDEIKVVPNPAHNQLSLIGSKIGQSYHIYDVTGRELQQGIMESQDLDIVGLDTGIYFVKIENKSVVSFLKK